MYYQKTFERLRGSSTTQRQYISSELCVTMDTVFLNRWIGRCGTVAWPLKSTYLHKLIFSLGTAKKRCLRDAHGVTRGLNRSNQRRQTFVKCH
ncbi:hypothetical protein AVEN_6639-1 [Araneus ventricosus]|uniref:Uncharacterized protein n=1 Tax=Araneus ventricosus TaxID=182803 RepID=A0A4Y2SZV6_ARAVE|nr:hypothetical protein AVEN_6639-1 [Araneus ventricosus]